ncbi:unnamed protein product [Cercopithifilaria johnstoni]|uniref:Uncharacterized protein n=1 Tax=Cercopithifilaria johnstoni TaxID=2874296 RepID=A0A8J2Q8H1_9BILA|nr:unnamed protein product [Cercopithifilaria johnstoni]
MTALYICSYLFPFTNRKGAITGLIIGILGALILFYLYFRVAPLRFHYFPKPCINGTSIPYSLILADYKFTHRELDFIPTVSQAITNKVQELLPFLCEIPISWYPLVTFTIAISSMLLVSFCTSNNDIDKFDWKLIICAPHIGTFIHNSDNAINYNKRVAFVECESFRYAQQTPYPDTVTTVTHMIH